MQTGRDVRDAVLFNAGLFVLGVIFVLAPVVGTLITSLHRDVTYLPVKFLGLTNYIRLAADSHFWESVQFTLLFVVVSVGLEMIFGLVFALLLNEIFKGRSVLRVIMLVPWVIPIAVSARVWELMYSYDFGLLNAAMMTLGLTDSPINWLGTPAAAFAAIVLSDMWKMTPFVTIILVAGLSIIPRDLYKQAMVDGTTFVGRFFRITLPLLKPVLIVALLFRTIDALRIFDLVYVLTGGGPGGGTTSLSLYGYKYFLAGDFGYGSAVSVVIFLVAGGLAVLYLWVGKFKEAIQ